MEEKESYLAKELDFKQKFEQLQKNNIEAYDPVRDVWENVGVRSKRCNSTESLRKKLQSGYDAIISHENKISEAFLKEISKINGLTVYGANYVNDIQDRTPTFAINMTQHTAPQLAQELVNRGIACAAGDFYAIDFPKVLGLETVEGFVRIAFFHYHTLEDVERVLRCLKDISANYHPTTEQ